MDKHIDRHLVINALLMAVWSRQPTETVLVHSDQGSQYGSADYLAFMKANNLKPSMRWRGNCHDNAVAESFFATFKKRVTRKKIYATREEAKREIFNFIEMFYNPAKRHSHTGGVPPAKLEIERIFDVISIGLPSTSEVNVAVVLVLVISSGEPTASVIVSPPWQH